MPDCSVDSIVTDPPYGLSFMGRKWDYDVPSVEIWAECLRVLKPGGHLLAFAGTRTQHRMAVRIEDAGFEIRDMIAWVYSTGFPKSMNLDRIKGEKSCGCEGSDWTQAECDVRPMRGGNVSPTQHAVAKRREVLQQGVQERHIHCAMQGEESSEGGDRSEECSLEGRGHAPQASGELCLGEVHPSAGACAADDPQGRVYHGAPLDHGLLDRSNATSAGGSASRRPQPAEQRQGESGVVAGQQEPQAVGAWPVCGGCGLPRVPSGLGTALKPALEPITVARKPLIGTVAANVLAHGTGALNIDGCRIEGRERTDYGLKNSARSHGATHGKPSASADFDSTKGRWPANMILQDCDEVVGVFPQASHKTGGPARTSIGGNGAYSGGEARVPIGYDDTGSAARFFQQAKHDAEDVATAQRLFYCAKASKRDRDEGLEGFEAAKTTFAAGTGLRNNGDGTTRNQAPSNKNIHPTVKPTDLMRYLCRLVTPPGGVVLDPFMGSGSTGKAAMLEGFRFIGIELSPEYAEIARARIEQAHKARVA